ncbi:Ataxin-3 [Takifugu flavidus]|uniref:ubiquitinyl hydrolase 1 n=1 Tax=Takifugu flavidus TaxID=433684 RepID=A0A5C6NZM8_9TELE|nr:Ataxin-3 [Takifugu flavidus]
MDSIFHEKQEGSLCAQHCLNNLLQGEYFTPVDLSSIAHQLDEEERMRMAEGGMASEEYRTFLQQPSGNMDDSGFFSIQVISNALKVWGLEIILFNSREYQSLMINPIGNLPECEAEQILKIMRVQQQRRPKLIGEEEAQTSAGRSAALAQRDMGFVLEDEVGEEDEELKRALALSRQDIDVEDEEADLRRAIQLSMQGAVMCNVSSESEKGNVKSSSQAVESPVGGQRGGQNETLTAEELRKRRQAYFDRQQQQAQPNIPQPDTKSTGGSGSAHAGEDQQHKPSQ